MLSGRLHTKHYSGNEQKIGLITIKLLTKIIQKFVFEVDLNNITEIT